MYLLTTSLRRVVFKKYINKKGFINDDVTVDRLYRVTRRDSPRFSFTKIKTLHCFGGVYVSELKMSSDFVSEIWSPYADTTRAFQRFDVDLKHMENVCQNKKLSNAFWNRFF